MNHCDEELRKAVALFRYGLIADVLRLPPGSREIRRTLHEKAQRTYTIPGTRRTRVAVETMRDWLSLYRTGGFEALYPKTRADRGRPRRLPPEVAELLVALKTEQPARSVKALIAIARERGVDHPLAPSTVHRLLSREGLLDKRPGEPVATDRRRFAFRDAGELWMSDVMHGPKVSDARRRRKTFLIAFIDDATRVLPFAAFAYAENTTAFLPVFKQAIARRGLPARLYVDNGANFRSQQLALVCAKLGIALIHARPYQPAGKGKIERFFRTLRAAWLRHLTAEATASLDTLNRTLWAWVEGEYHQSPHRGLDGRTPLDQWALAGHDVRYPDPGLDLDGLFLFEAKRRVMKDRTVSLHGRLYEVDAVLVGQTVTLRYDPDAPPSRPIEVVHDRQGCRAATRLDAYANTAVKRDRPSSQLQCDTPPSQPPLRDDGDLRIPVIPITDSGVMPITDSMLSDHQSERSDAGVPLWGEVIGLVQRSVCLSHGFSFQVELVGVVDEPVEDGVCEGGLPDHGMPALHGQLRGHDRGAQSMAVLDDLEQVAAVLGAELRHPPVVDDQDGGLGDRGEQLGIAPVGARDGQLGEQAWEAPVRGGVSVAARAVSEGAGYPTLSHAGRPRDQDVEVVTDPAPVGQRQDEVAVEASGLAEVDVLDAGRVTEPGAAQPVGELARGALGELAVDNEPEAFLEAEGLDLG